MRSKASGRVTWTARLGAATISLAVALLWAPPLLAQEHGEGGGLLSINPGLVIWTWIIFLILLFVLGKWAWGPMLGALESRERRIQETLDQAAREREEANRLLEEHRRLLNEARGQAQEILAEGKKAAERLRTELLEEGRKQKEHILHRAREEIGRERDRALDALRREAVDLSITVASRVLERNVDSDENRRVALDYVERLAAEQGGGGGG